MSPRFLRNYLVSENPRVTSSSLVPGIQSTKAIGVIDGVSLKAT